MIGMKCIEKLSKAVNKNLKIDEKQGVLIKGWSPNNVRFLYLGASFAYVVYHCAPSGTRYARIGEIIDFTTCEDSPRIDDVMLGLLQVLTQGRVCSCIEEIMLGVGVSRADVFRKICGNAVIETRFPRLAYISCIGDAHPQLFMKYFKNHDRQNETPATKRYVLFYDWYKEQGNQILGEYYKRDEANPFWKGSYLRPKFYIMDADGGPIYTKFEKLRLTEEKVLEDKKLLALYKSRIDKSLAKIDSLMNVIPECSKVYLKFSAVDKVLWAKCLTPKALFIAFSKRRNLSEKQLSVGAFMATIKFKGSHPRDSLDVLESYLSRELLYRSVYRQEEESDVSVLKMVNAVELACELLTVLLGAIYDSIWVAIIAFLTLASVEDTQEHQFSIAFDGCESVFVAKRSLKGMDETKRRFLISAFKEHKIRAYDWNGDEKYLPAINTAIQSSLQCLSNIVNRAERVVK